MAGISPFWSAEIIVPALGSEPGATATATIPPSPLPVVEPAEFGGCSINPSCAQTFAVAYRMCFANEAVTVEVRTAPSPESIDLPGAIYLFNAQGDLGPLNGDFDPAAWPPSYPEFWVAPIKPFERYDANSIQICTTAEEPTVDICVDSILCVFDTGVLTCPEGTIKRTLSGTSFQLRAAPGRESQCMYAAVTSATGTSMVDVGITISTRQAQLNPDEAGCAPLSTARRPHALHLQPCRALRMRMPARRVPRLRGDCMLSDVLPRAS